MAIKTRKVRFGIVAGWNPEWPDPRGVRVTEKNIDDVANWIGGKAIARTKVVNGDIQDHNVKIFTDRSNRVRVARVGDVIYRIPKDHSDPKSPWMHFVIKEADFLGFES